MSEAALNDGAKRLLAEPVIANLATVEPDGTPHITPVWIDEDGGDLLVNTLKGRHKTKNMQRSAKVAVCVVDPQNPFRVLSLEGTVSGLVEEGADEHIDALTMKYMGLDKHPFQHPGDTRVIVRIHPERVLVQPAE